MKPSKSPPSAINNSVGLRQNKKQVIQVWETQQVYNRKPWHYSHCLFCLSSQIWRWTAIFPPVLRICQLRNHQQRSRKSAITKTNTSFSMTPVNPRVYHSRQKKTNPRKAWAVWNHGNQRGPCPPPGRQAVRSYWTKQMIFPEVEAKDKIKRGSKNQSSSQKNKADQSAPLGSGRQRQRLVQAKEKGSEAENRGLPAKKRMNTCIQPMKTCLLSNKGDAPDSICVCVWGQCFFHIISGNTHLCSSAWSTLSNLFVLFAVFKWRKASEVHDSTTYEHTGLRSGVSFKQPIVYISYLDLMGG